MSDRASEWRQATLFDDELEVVRPDNIKAGISVEDRMSYYQAFLDKFKGKKTTDDCYTPPEVYDAILGWLKGEGLIDDTTNIVRPFYPGEDFTQWEYPDGCVVVDNPPFSIYSFIVRWFIERGVKFFLFGPQLTLRVHKADVCFLPVSVNITYQNGANVNTGFVTNLIEGVRIWTAPELHAAIDAVAPPPRLKAKNTYPHNFTNCATLGKVAVRLVDFKVMASECEDCGNLDALRDAGTSVFGGGWLLSERAAAERAAAERAAAERAAGISVQLSPREWEIVKRLSR